MTVRMKPFAPGHRFVKYDIRGLLGMGGHAHVYDAHDPFLDREVAVKVIAAPKDSRENLAKRAQSEARVLVRIDHPNVVKVFDAGATEDGLVYLVMEKLQGRTLREVYTDLGQLTVVEALELAKQICAGVHAAHQMGVIHRDLKPENVFVQSDNRVKVLDFGISKVMGYGAHDTTQRHVLHGTVLYMSPEHLQGYGVTRKSDVFALGTLLYEGLYAHPTLLWPEARLAKDVREVIRIQLAETPPMLHELDARIFRHVSRFVHRAILKAAEQRYESMADMLEAALAAWDRIELEQGHDYIVQWRRDLSRAVKAGTNQQPQRDTVQSAMRFSTDLEPERRMTQLGGLTPPVPLTSTHRDIDSSVGLPFQTTTPVPSSDPSRSPSSRPVVVVPPLGAPSALVTPLPSTPRDLTSSRMAPTPEQSATLALAEQVTRTASVGIVDPDGASAVTPRSPGVDDSGSLSVAPVSHSSMLDPSSLPMRAAGMPAPWFGRHSVRIIVGAGGCLGLLLGVVYGVAAMRGKAVERAAVQATTPEANAATVAHARGSDQNAAAKRNQQPTGSVGMDAKATATAAASASAGLAAEISSSPASASTDEAAPKSDTPPPAPPARAVKRAAGSSTTASPTKRAHSSSKAPAPAGSALAGTRAKEGDGAGSWLKPDMIYYPDETAPLPKKSVAATKASASAKPSTVKQPPMPASGLD